MTWRTPPYAIHRFQSGPFERTSKRRNGFASESRVKRGQRVVHGDKELLEKLGRNDPCPCGSGRRFQAVLLARWSILTVPRAMSISATSEGVRSDGPECRRGESGKRSRSRACDLGVRVSPSAPLFSIGDMRVVPRPVCKTGARPSTGGPIPPSPTAFAHCLRSSIGQSKRLLPVRFQVQLLAGAPVSIARWCSAPTCLAFIQETVGWNPTRATLCRRGETGRRTTPRT